MIKQKSLANNDPSEKLLQQIGLSQSEAKLYLVALAMGPVNVIQLSHRSGLSRQMVYLLLPCLQVAGLIKQVREANRVLYQALSPKLLKSLVKDVEKRLDELIPTLEASQPENEAVPLISVYGNGVAMREWYLEFMKKAKAGDELLVYSSGQFWHWYDIDPKFYNRYLRFTDRKGIRSRILLPASQAARDYQKTIGSSARQARFTKYLNIQPIEKWLWRDYVCYQTIRGGSMNLVVLKSAAVAELEQNIFAGLWAKASRP